MWTWYFTVILVCISLIIGDAEQHFSCAWSLLVYLLWINVYFLVHFKVGVLFFDVQLQPFFYILWILTSLSDIWFFSIFSHSMGCLLFCWCNWQVHRRFWFWWSIIYPFFPIAFCTFGCMFMKLLPDSVSWFSSMQFKNKSSRSNLSYTIIRNNVSIL